jgi:hypothetical protein
MREMATLTFTCDNCGATAEVPTGELPEGWVTGETLRIEIVTPSATLNDLCDDCSVLTVSEFATEARRQAEYAERERQELLAAYPKPTYDTVVNSV